MSRFVRNIDFSSLGLKDLVEARDLYHVHVANLENVVGTAIGRYRIRRSDPDFGDPSKPGAPDAAPRTLANSGVKPWSWPCVLVFVNEWESREQLGDKPAQLVPPRLYLPDGRVVPTCVVYAPRQLAGPPPLQSLNFPSGLLGGGYPILTDDQEQQRVGSVGCLVSDGYYTYALTSQHVVGNPGTLAYVIERGKRRVVATAHTRAEEKVSFDEAYPGFPGARTLVNVDAGLLRIGALPEWTSQVYGIGPIGELIDLGVDTLNLDLIGCPVRANGGASGQLSGEIQGLFYRYRAVGGFDYVAELLIGPREGQESVETRPGDSGSIWFWDAAAEPPLPGHQRPEKLTPEQAATAPNEPVDATEQADPRAAMPALRPLGLQWGGHSFLELGGQVSVQFALASSLSTVCRLLDVELLRDWSLGHSLYWGKVGHYKIAFTACRLASNESLDRLLKANATRISVSDQDIRTGNLPAAGSAFVALADVADLVWRNTRKKDEANHFADMDEPGGGPGNKTLMELWATPANRTPQKWTEFYDNLPEPPEDKHRGALPFRVREHYEAMVKFVAAGDLASFVGAAGTLAHYVGDACQPLHISRLHHGRPGHPEESDVHSFYETRMLDRFAPEVVTRINEEVQSQNVKVDAGNLIKGGAAAADHVVQLMKETIQVLPPEVVVQTWVDTQGPTHTKDLWDALGDRTVQCMIAGARCLAELWQSAWEEGKGDTVFQNADLDTPIDKTVLKGLYDKTKFVESRWLKDMTFP